MKYNNFWKLMGISLICITVFGVSNANAKTTTMFTFTVDKPVNGQDACAPKIETEYGTGEYEECIRIKTTQQIMGANGCVADTTVTPNPTYSGWICSGNDGTNGTACSVKSSTRDGKAVTTKFDCGGVETEVVTNDGNDGQAGISCTMNAVKKNNGDLEFTKQCGNEPTPTTVTMTTAEIATAATNKIVQDGTVALKDDISDFQTASDVNTLISNATTKEKLKQKLDSEYLSEVPNTVALKEDISGFQTASDVNTLISTATTKEKLKQKLDGEYLTGIPDTVAMKDDLNGYVTTSGSGNNSIGKILESNNVITTSNLSQNNIVTTGTLGNAVTNAIAQDSTIVKTTDNGYKEIQAQAAGALQANDVNQNYLVDKLGNAYVTPGGLNTAVSSAIANDSTIVKTTDADYKAIQDQVAGALQANNIGTCTTTSTAERTSTTCTGAMATIFNQLKEAINVAATGKQQQ